MIDWRDTFDDERRFERERALEARDEFLREVELEEERAIERFYNARQARPEKAADPHTPSNP